MLKVKQVAKILILCLTLSACSRDLTFYNDTTISNTQYGNVIAAEAQVARNRRRSVKYEMIDMYSVKDADKEILLSRTQQELNNLLLKVGYYGIDSENNYLNFLLDPFYLNSKNFTYKFFNNASNYYVQVDIKGLKNNHNVAALKKPANYVGIYGAINYDENANVVVDDLYLKTLVDTLNTYRRTNGLDELDDEIEQINYIQDFEEEVIFSDSFRKDVVVGTESEIKEDLSEQYEIDQQQEDIIKEIQDDEAIKEANKDSFNRTVRKLIYNAHDFNSIVGISRDYFSVIPSPLAVFNIQEVNSVQGYCLYNWGETIKELQNNNSTDISLTFIFQRSETDNDFDFLTYFPSSMRTKVINPDSTVDYISDFVKNNVDIIIEDFNRAYNNKDITRLTSGELISPQDLGLYWLLQRDSVSINLCEIWLNKFLKKEGNTYLVLLNQVSNEICRGVEGTPGRFYRTWYARIGMEDNVFKILDMYPASLDALRVPNLPIQTGRQEKLNSLQRQDIKDTVHESIKNEIRSELEKLEIALTNRYNVDRFDKNNKILIENDIPHYGISNRFSTDKTILKSNKLDEVAETLSNKITKHGVKTQCKVTILPSVWIQGSDNQVELISNFIFIYGDFKYADIMNVYMIYNKFKNNWTIDQFNVLSEQEMDSKAEIQTLYNKYVGENTDGKK